MAKGGFDVSNIRRLAETKTVKRAQARHHGKEDVSMEYSGRRQRSFLQSFILVGVMLLVMGIVFSAVAVIMQLVSLSPESMTLTVNGERVPATEDTLALFRRIFLLGFGIVGLILLFAGGAALGTHVGKKRKAAWLKAEGAHIRAEVTEVEPTAVYVNHRPLGRIFCSYTDYTGTTYIFKSGSLRIDPVPYLRDGCVDVYYDRGDMKKYFVDVDGSVGLGSGRVVEL